MKVNFSRRIVFGKMKNKNFFLLWNGQLVSALGDALYAIALNFFILQETGSTAIMGTVMALVTLPRIILGPVSGVYVDKVDRKLLIVWGDIIRGLSIIFVAVMAYFDRLEIWMVMVVAVVLGVCASFFNPSVESVLPDIVPSDKMIKASSSYQIATTGADILGQSVGGALYVLVGAPLMFLMNGVSYLLSAVSECFIRIPKVSRKNVEISFKEDFKEGLRFILAYEGLVRTIAISFFINFLFGMIRVSIIPWFVNTENLGMTKYGVLNAFQSVGLIVGMLVLSFINIKQGHKYKIYLTTLFLFIVSIGLGAFFNQYVLILILFAVGFAFQFVFNTVLNSTIMLKTPMDKRGKVSATKTTIGMAVSPLGNFVGGILCEFIVPRYLIMINAVLAVVVVCLVVIHPTVKSFLVEES